ncbi:cation transporter [Propionibacterium freudenreichii]|nr:cation transporter [Propionibacterium freudenreichii]MDK9353339.1 cation transporter [Propionibacterium freudenreichii]MDK9645979.1 cation transporter [Propionibacterium freudenreichii]MDK9654512.1 cation transporter [Propionibacterium freudenreichii]MDK9666739.1 cation transporter [Propionibacterium freudenreichii]
MADHAKVSDGADEQHSHSHGVSANADRRYLWGALIALALFMLGEVVVAFITGSLALLSDAGHMLSDVASIGVALWAMTLAARPARGRWTYGFKRAEILAALANGVTLLVLGLVLAVEAVRRLITPPQVHAPPVIVVAVVGIAVNFLATWLLARANRTSLNVRGAYQHILTDLFGFIGTLVAGLVILFTGWTRADALASLVVVALMLRAGWPLVKESGSILLEAAPPDIDLDEVRKHLMDLDHVIDVHDLHVWTLTDGLPAVSAHVVTRDDCFIDGDMPELLDELQDCLRTHFDIEHSTFQLEPGAHAQHEPGMHHH